MQCISRANMSKNNLSFVEMLRPFCLVNVDHCLRDPSGNDHPIQKLQICIQDVNDRPPQPSLAKKFLNESVSCVSCDNMKEVNVGNLTLKVPAENPWFQSWTNTFLQVQFPSDHEFTKHLLGCLLVTSSVDPPETLQLLLNSLQQMQATAPARLPKWFSSSIFKFYVLLHDSKDGDKAKALNFFNSLKTAYGPDNCFFLEINSQNPDHNSNTQDYWNSFISRKNIDLDGSDFGSSPRTPAESSGISGMPNSVAIESEISLKARGSPEIVQETEESSVPLVIHPLSPEAEITNFRPIIVDQSGDLPKVVNANVWNNSHNTLQLGSCLSSSDIESIKSLVKHLTTQVLIPHVEKQIFTLSDLASNKKGVSRSLLSATKRLFGSAKPGSPSSTPLNSVIYSYDAPELNFRRLGDLYFMFTNYSLAFQIYHSAKRDFGADQAWIYYAGALEMAALSAFMQGEVTKKAVDYMEEAILTYLNSCKLSQFATRATLLSTPFLRERQMYGEAAKQLIRMASEDSDLRSALLLEQASYCFLYSTKPNMYRKYAFHMVLAGHRFSKGGQRKHALRCYKQAYQLYKGKGWSLAEDHIHFTVGRLAGHLKLLNEASSSLAFLLSSESKQTAAQQETYLREYLQMLQQSIVEESSESLTVLPLPIIEDNSILVLVSSFKSNLVRAFEPDSPADSVRWSRMEELALTESQGPPMIFKSTIHLYSKKTINTSHPVVVVNEPMYVQVSLKNPLQISLPMLHTRLLWSFTDENDQSICNECITPTSESLVKTDVLDCLLLEPNCTQQITLSLTPLAAGQIHILGMLYSISTSSVSPAGNNQQQSISLTEVPGKQIFVVRGPKLKAKKEGSETNFEKDKRLEIKVIKSAPLLKVDLDSELKHDMLCGEIQEVCLKLQNVGNSSLNNLYMVTCSPRLMSLSNKYVESDKTLNEFVTDESLNSQNLPGEKNALCRVIKLALKDDGVLKGGGEILLPLWVRAPYNKGFAKLDILFYYENLDGDHGIKYRVSRCSLEMNVHRSIQYSAVASRSTLCEDKDTININVTVQNLNENNDPLTTEVSLVQMSLASSAWQLQEKPIYSTEMLLKSQQKYYFLIRADRISEDKLSVSDVCFENKPVTPGNCQPYYDFFKWDTFYEKEQETATNLFNLFLYMRWNAKITRDNHEARTVCGQSLVTLNQLRVAKVWPPEPKNELLSTEGAETFKIFGPERKVLINSKNLITTHLENALSFNLVHENNVTHSFSENRLCRVDMKLILRNCFDFPLRVIINSPDSKFSQSVIPKTQLYTPHSSSTFTWAGRSNALIKLDGRERGKVMLSAVFTAPGTYDLGSRLTVAAAAEGDTNYVIQACRVQSAIIIFGKQSYNS